MVEIIMPMGMGVVVRAVEKFFDALVDEGVVRDVVTPVFQLLASGQLAKKTMR